MSFGYRHFLFINSFALAAISMACSPESGATSSLKVTNGIETTEYPGVVELDSNGVLCTGSFIAPDIILTAAHCIAMNDGGSADLYKPVKAPALNIESTHIVVHPLYEKGVPTHDLARLHFTTRVASTVYQVSKTPAEQSDVVTLVGFGDNQYEDVDENISSGAGKKRIGRNFVNVVQNGTIYFEGTPSAGAPATGDDSASGRGDSGGPLFNSKGEIVGVACQGFYSIQKKKKVSVFVDLTSKASQVFLNNNESSN